MTCCECGEEVTELPDLAPDFTSIVRLVHVDARGRFLEADHEAIEGPCEKRGWLRRLRAA